MENFFIKLSIMLVPALMAITCHEVSHGFVADRLGDRTARSMGRLTLNPLKHLDIFGTIMVFIVGIGWAKPVPVNFNNLRNPKRDMIWVAGAGPVTNFTLAVISALVMRGLATIGEGLHDSSSVQLFLDPLILMTAFSLYVNLLLCIFNLIPLPPLDGGRVAVGLLPYRQAELLSRVEPFGMIIIIVLVFFTNLFSRVISPILDFAINILAGPHRRLVYSVTDFLMR
ncbi:MAG: site-2 protease family protein [Desulfuromonadales bacterium]|nr:MAG: site-2 protease family protein [Desulfuromonadales bacterium]